MSFDADIRLKGLDDKFFDLAQKVKNDARYFDKKIAENQVSTKWYVAAIIVGAVVIVGAGSLGAMGLLKFYGLMNLPSALHAVTSPVGAVAITASGFAIGAALVGFGAFKTHQARRSPNDNLEELRKQKEEFEKDVKALNDIFGDYFEMNNIKPDKYNNMDANSYTLCKTSSIAEYSFVIIKKEANKDLKCTRIPLNNEQSSNVTRYFKIQGIPINQKSLNNTQN